MFRRAVCFSVISLMSLPGAQAGIQLDATRVIYPEGKKETTLGIKNEASDPRLIQSWVDAGEGNDVTPPFIITPPIFRIDPGKGQSLRISFIGGEIPRDRESVFWVNILEVKPQPQGKKAGTENYIQFPVRTRLKLFYRPEGLPGSPEEAVSQLRWRRGKHNAIECINPSAFTLSFQDIRLTPPSGAKDIRQSGMCPAKGQQVFLLPGKEQAAQGKVFFTTINDYGGYTRHEAVYHHE
ncbi:Chaperone protein EcpD precursor [Phytobacter ursingii]|nr:Chaperone protein EcpD precursor [Phytobacter ursingii]